VKKKKKKKKKVCRALFCFAPVLFSLSLSLSRGFVVLRRYKKGGKIQNVKTLNLRVKPTLSNFEKERERETQTTKEEEEREREHNIEEGCRNIVRFCAP
jgi:hypothetical protein